MPPKKATDTDYFALGNLEGFPFLLQRGDVLNILHLVDDSVYGTLKNACGLKDDAKRDVVTSQSMKDHLLAIPNSRNPKYTADQVNEIMKGVAATIEKTDVVKMICSYDLNNCPGDSLIPKEVTRVSPEYYHRSSLERYLGIAKKHKEDKP